MDTSGEGEAFITGCLIKMTKSLIQIQKTLFCSLKLRLNHGIMGRRFPDNFLFFLPHLDV